MKVVITDDRFGTYEEEKAVFAQLSKKLSQEIDLVNANCKTEEELIKACSNADALLVNQAKINQNIISRLTQCKVISRYGIGIDNVDALSCKKNNIVLCNVPSYCESEVAEHALSLLLSLLRGINERDKKVKCGEWTIPSEQRVICNSTIGIVGWGKIAQSFAKLVVAFNPKKILVWSPNINQDKLCNNLLTATSFENLLTSCDYISIHIKLSEKTKHLFNKNSFAKMKHNSVLINTSRGGIINTIDLIEALQNGNLSGAGLDVLEEEPPKTSCKLLKLNNVILTDHCAYRSKNSISELKHKTAQNAADVLENFF